MIDDAATHRYEQISVFFGKNFVVTFQEREGDPFDPVRKRIRTLRSQPAAHAQRRLSRLCADRCRGRQLFSDRRGDRRQGRRHRGRTCWPRRRSTRCSQLHALRRAHQRAEARDVAAARCAGHADPQRRALSQAPRPRSSSTTRSTIAIRLIETGRDAARHA